MLFHLSGRLPSGGGFKRAEKERTRDVGEELFYIPPDAVLCYVKNNVDFTITINEYRHNAITNIFVAPKHGHVVAAVCCRVPSSINEQMSSSWLFDCKKLLDKTGFESLVWFFNLFVPEL